MANDHIVELLIGGVTVILLLAYAIIHELKSVPDFTWEPDALRQDYYVILYKGKWFGTLCLNHKLTPDECQVCMDKIIEALNED